MPKIQIRNRQIFVGNKSLPLIAGEVHYWRLNPLAWKEILLRVREMGLEIISTYIPWDFHECEKGKFDFTGKTAETRNLKAFLDLTREENFKVIIRPGPYIYSEWPRDGVPPYAYEHHRLHPQFLKQAKNYLGKVVSLLKPYFATQKNGHIVLLQADNEIDPWPDTFGPQYGLHDKPGLFQDYLKELYGGSIEALNESWAAEYSDFDEARPFIATMLPGEKGLALKGNEELKRNIDYIRFKQDYSRRVADWNVKAYRDLGVDIPIYLNTYPFFYAHDWAGFQKVSDMVGVDLYPTNEFKEDRFEQRKFMDKIRYLRSVSSIPFIAEFEAGVWHGRHYETGVLTGNHYRLICLSALLAGATGWNWYMLVNRDNWYMSPINEWGRVRGELYSAFKQMVSLFHQMDPASLEKIGDVAVTYNPMQYAVRSIPHENPVLTALYDADIDYECWNPSAGECEKKIVFYSGNQWLEREAQKKLRKYVEDGGTLVAFRDFPRKDEFFKPCSLTGFEEPVSALFEFKREFQVCLGKSSPVKINSSVYLFDKHAELEMISGDLGGGYGTNAVGYIKKIGRGRILHLGMEPSPQLLRAVLDFFHLPAAARALTKDIHTSLYRRGKKLYLVAVNNGEEDKTVRVEVDGLSRSVKAKDLESGFEYSVLPGNKISLVFDIPRKDGKILELR